MKKAVSRILLLAMILYLCMPVASYVYAKENVKVMINDVCIDDSAYAETIGDKLYVSARSVADPMGINLNWNDVKKTLLILHKDTSVSLMVASNLAIINNSPVETEQPLRIVSDRAIIDLGFVCRVLGATMTFDDGANTYSVAVDVPEDFEPDVIKPEKSADGVQLFESAVPKMTMVREIAEALSLDVSWNDSVKSITLTSEYGDTLVLYVGDNVAWFNGDVLDCSAPLTVIDDRTYIEYEFVEKLFTVQVPQEYSSVRSIALELGLEAEWSDETKTVNLVAKNGDTLSMSVGSCYYKLNDKFFSNSAPLILKDGVAFTDLVTVEEAFAKKITSDEGGKVELFSSSKDFSGQLVFEKKLNTFTYVDVIVISVQSIVYNNYTGLKYTDYNAKRVSVPANTRTVDFSVAKTNWDYYDSYIMGYSFPMSNDYYYNSGYLSYNGGVITYLSSYSYNYTLFERNDSTSDIVIRPKVYSNVTLDDVTFSGVLKTDNGAAFGADSQINISVREVAYYGEIIMGYTNITPGNTTQTYFSINVPNDSTTRNNDLYLRYSLYDSDATLNPIGYYESPTSSVNSINRAKGWDITTDKLTDISFVVISRNADTLSGRFYLPDGMVVENNRSISFGIDIQTVQTNVYSQYYFVPYESYDNVAVMEAGENSVDYSLQTVFDSSETYVFEYRINDAYPGLAPYGYATTGLCTQEPRDALWCSGYGSFSDINFGLRTTAMRYEHVNNLPFYDVNGYISSSSYDEYTGSCYEGYYIYLTKGQKISIRLSSYDFDTFLYLLDGEMNVIDYDDDGQGNRNSLINKLITKTGYYYVRATSYNGNSLGEYMLTINTDKPLSGGAVFTDQYNNTLTDIIGNETVTANYTIENTEYATKTVRLVMAVYNSDNAMIGIKIKDFSLYKGVNDVETLTMNLGGYSDVKMVKSFVLAENCVAAGNVDCLYR